MQTDAPKDIGGDASACSPTDLLSAAAAACILTTIGMFLERHDFDSAGSRASVEKVMSVAPRRLGSLVIDVHLPITTPLNLRPGIEKVGNACPVKASLHTDIAVCVNYAYDIQTTI